MSTPKAQARPQITFIFDLPAPGLEEQDVGKMMSSFEFKGMVNGGYIIKGKLIDPNFNVLNRLVDTGYFTQTRTRPVPVIFQIRWGPKNEAQFPESATKERQVAYLLTLKASGEQSGDTGMLEFVAMDPPSWFLNMGDGSGDLYKGKVSDAIRQVVNEYAPKINLDISRTTDSSNGKWWMMRQDPKSFISSLFDWSASVTQKKTQWVFAPDGFDLVIKEQAELQSKQRGFYRFMDGNDHDTIRNWEFLADNALSVVESKLITQGLSAISGQYLDRITDENENQVFVKDSRTSNKKIARIKKDQGFTKPPDAGPQQVGWSSVTSIPEDSAGGLGLRYDEYIDGRPRAMWLNLVNALMRVKLECIGHGEWSSCKGLGCDTVFVKWTSGPTGKSGDKPFWWMTGNWLVYGFHHRVTRGFWFTDLYLARFDHDASATKVGGSGQ